MVQASTAAAMPERRWQGRRIIGWLDWAGVDKRGHASHILDAGTRLQIHEQERSHELPGGKRTGTKRLLRGI